MQPSRSGRGSNTRLAVLAVVAGMTTAGVCGCAVRPSLDALPRTSTYDAPAPTALQVRFFGTTTVLFSDGAHAVLIDGFFSRPSAGAVLFGRLRSDPELVERHLADAGVERLSAVYVAHTHYDHALDATTAARLFGAELFGTSSLARIAAAEGYGGRVTPLAHGEARTFGRFTVTPYATEHSPGDLAPGPVRPDFAVPARARAYREGGSFAFLVEHDGCRVLVVPSAGLVGETFRDVRADVVMLGVGRLGRQPREKIRAYWRDSVVATGARSVIPIHWDDFTRPLEEPLVAMPWALDRVDRALSALREEAEASTSIELPITSAPMRLSAEGPCGRSRSLPGGAP